MNYKFLIPSYRTRYNKIIKHLANISEKRKIDKLLNLGCGEGDYDKILSNFCNYLYCCDINKGDIKFCKYQNKSTKIFYSIQDAECLNYHPNFFDIIICSEVLEHVNSQSKVMENIKRTLKKKGLSIITFPNINFPSNYDPINKLLSNFNIHLPIGAYAFGHEKLIKTKDFENLCEKLNFKILKKEHLSHNLVGILEIYWTGILQKIIKLNSKNKNQNKSFGFRMKNKKPPEQILKLIDFFIKKDEKMFRDNSSIGILYLLEKL